jgi:hypothetical protein
MTRDHRISPGSNQATAPRQEAQERLFMRLRSDSNRIAPQPADDLPRQVPPEFWLSESWRSASGN